MKLIKNYAHDYRDLNMDENDIKKMLESFSIELIDSIPELFKKELASK